MRRLISSLVSLLVLFYSGILPATAQSTEREDALFHCLSDKLGTRPGDLRDAADHTRAFDPKTGRNFHYDADKKAWIDSKTGESMNGNLEDCFFQCLSRKLGTRPGDLRDAGDHTRAFDPKTGRNFHYDATKEAWVDSKTGECVCPKCPEKTVTSVPPAGEDSKPTKPVRTASSTIKKVAIVVVVGCLIATAIAVPIAVCCAQHHHHSSPEVPIASSPTPSIPPPHMPADLPMPSLP